MADNNASMFTGKYYNRRTTQGMPAHIKLEYQGIRISFSTGNESGEVYWHLSDIKKAEFTGDTTLLRYGKNSKQSISVYNQEFEKVLRKKYKGATFLKPKYNFSIKSVIGIVVAGGLIMLGLLVAFLVWGIPAIADKVAMSFPETYEHQLGEQLYQQIISGYEVDKEKTEALNAYLQELEVISDFPLQATVVESEDVNAFAVPGGFVVVHEGLLNKMQRHEELAALLGHELAHVQLRHSTRALTRSLSYYMLLSLLFGDLSGISAVIIDNASTLKNLEYSRSLEEEADQAGLQLLWQNNLNPQGMVWLLERLSQNGTEQTEFLSTHPATEARIKAVKAQIGQQKQKAYPDKELEQYWKSLKAENSSIN